LQGFVKAWFTFLCGLFGAFGLTELMLAGGSAKDTWTTWVVIGAGCGAVLGRGLAVGIKQAAEAAGKRAARQQQADGAPKVKSLTQ
jgi:hypothetical protein